MEKRRLEILSILLAEYYKDKYDACGLNCSQCDLGILESSGSGYSCAIETAIRNVERDIREGMKDRR